MIKFKLSLHNNGIIQKWRTNKDKPLLIVGDDGSGKSTLANDILSEYHIIRITNEFIKYKGDINEYLDSCLHSKNVLMMLDVSLGYKGLLIDDIQLLFKYDKRLLTSMLLYAFNINYKEVPVVLVINKKDDLMKDNLINNLYNNSYVIKLNYNFERYSDIIKLHHNHSICNKDLIYFIKSIFY